MNPYILLVIAEIVIIIIVIGVHLFFKFQDKKRINDVLSIIKQQSTQADKEKLSQCLQTLTDDDKDVNINNNNLKEDIKND